MENIPTQNLFPHEMNVGNGFEPFAGRFDSYWGCHKYKMSDNKCLIPFTGSVVIDLSNNTTTPCCVIPPMKFNPTEGVVTKELVDLRKTIIQNKRHELCVKSGCWKIDDEGGPSLRRRYNSYAEPVNFDSFDVNSKPQKVTVVFSNKCQMMCMYCGPNQSSTWENNLKIPIIQQKPKKISLSDLVDVDNLAEILISGGEPMLDEDCISFLMNLKYSPKRSLILITNLSYGPAVFSKLLSIIEKHPNISIGCSLDSLNSEKYRKYINMELWFKNFEVLAKNLQSRRKIYPNAWLEVKSVLGIFNYKDIQKLIEYVLDFRLNKKYGITFSINPIVQGLTGCIQSGIVDDTRIVLSETYTKVLSKWEIMQIESTNKFLDSVVYDPGLEQKLNEFLKTY